MPAFDLYTELRNYFRKTAQDYNCNPCFDAEGKGAKIDEMNVNGENGVPCCPINGACPCDALKNAGECEYNVFERV